MDLEGAARSVGGRPGVIHVPALRPRRPYVLSSIGALHGWVRPEDAPGAGSFPGAICEAVRMRRLGAIVGLTAPVFAPLDSMLDRMREAEGLTFESEGD